MYAFMAINGLVHWADQKYKNQEQIRMDFTQIQQEYQDAVFPPDILEKLRKILEEVDNRPLIVRSSSLLEDNFGTSFAGKYDSVFLSQPGHPRREPPEFNECNYPRLRQRVEPRCFAVPA